MHKENGGPAAARKYGIDNSNGDYLAFCDADDYVDVDWLLTMYKYLKKYNADISRIMAYINEQGANEKYEEPYSVNIWNQDEAIEQFIKHKDVNGTLWTCLFKRYLFDNLSWNFDMHYLEDDYLVWQILGKVDKYIKIRVPRYHYSFCETSLTNQSYNFNRYQSTNYLLERIISDCKKTNTHLFSARKMWYQWKFFNYLRFSTTGNMPNEIKKEMRKTLSNDFVNYFKTIAGINSKFTLICLILSPSLLTTIYRLARK